MDQDKLTEATRNDKISYSEQLKGMARLNSQKHQLRWGFYGEHSCDNRSGMIKKNVYKKQFDSIDPRKQSLAELKNEILSNDIHIAVEIIQEEKISPNLL